jgi:outer-membrane receptor for ferric coprogen and ferric-rhodotorulic acid
MIDRVEVLQCAAGLLTGAGAPGGTINIVRKMPAKTQGGYVEATAGPWDGGRLVADVSTPIDASGKVRARLVGVYNYDDSYIDYVYNRQGMFYGVVQADLTRTTLLTAGANV